MEKVAFDHTGFITPSLEGSVRFWSEVMGFDPKPSVERKGDWVAPFTGVADAELKIAHLFGLGTHLEFIEFGASGGASGKPSANDCGAGHVCFKVQDLDGMVERILAGGGTLAGRVTTITEGPAAGIRGLYLRDPYGVLIELLEAS
jgi:catechol 2,3-dioxygenase-like lactoylglutathione lyase family enzyme